MTLSINKNNLKPRITKLILIAVCITVVAPFFYLAFFNSPSSDDYSDYILVRDNEFFKSLWEYYNGWSGRFTSISLVLLLNPLKGGHWWVVILTCVQLGMYISLWYLITVLFERMAGLKYGRLPVFTILLVYGFCYLHRPVELLYWFTGSWAYLPGLVLIAGWACIRYSVKPLTRFYKCLLVILPFFIAGTNELCLCLMLVVLLLPGKPFLSWKLRLSIVAGFIPGFALAVFAPGNSVRAGHFQFEMLQPVHDLHFSIQNTLRISWFFLRDWLRSTPIIPVALLLGFIGKKGETKKISYDVIYLIAGCSACLMMIFAFLWSTGNITPPDRLLDVLFICFSVVILFSVSQFVRRVNDNSILSSGLVTISAALLLFYASYDSKLRVALNDIDLIEEYQKDMRMRKNLTENCARLYPEDTLYLPAIRNIPNTIFYSEFSPSPLHWYNKSYANYFNLKAVVLFPDKKKPGIKN